MKVYVIVSITAEGKVLTNFSVEPVSVCSTLEKALDYVNELEKNTYQDPKMYSETAYDIFEFDLDEEPLILGFLKKEMQLLQDGIQQAVMELMNKGYVDQLIGEDGNFYYTLTDMGKDKMKSMPEQIKKFFRKKD
tara:strand:+ start:549 stop:953 length:405 start_codon:yes stop_codon:yes gene_type:complete